MLGVQNRDSVRWRCRFHGVVWVATVASRTQNVDRLGGCARCRGERMGETVRSAIPREGSRIVEVERPDIAAEFVENVTTPGRGPDRFTIYCKDEVRWRCSVCEFEYEQTVGARLARINPRCSNCNTGGHRLLEVQCAALVSAQLDVEVLLGQRIANLRPDLWLPVQRVGVDLDPEWSHRAHLERDIRKGAACMGAMNGFARIREAGLPPSGTWDYWVSCDADIDMWADAAIRAIESLTSLSRSHLDSQQRLDVLHGLLSGGLRNNQTRTRDPSRPVTQTFQPGSLPISRDPGSGLTCSPPTATTIASGNAYTGSRTRRDPKQ